MPDAVRLASLKVAGDLDMSGYAQGAKVKVQADQTMVNSGAATQASITQLETKLKGTAGSFDSLRRSAQNLGSPTRFFADTPSGTRRLIQMNQAVDALTRSLGRNTGGLRLNRIGMLELQAAGINSFQALAAGMSPLRVAMMEGGQVIGAFLQGGISLRAALAALATPMNITIAGVAALAAGFGFYELVLNRATSAADAHKETEAALKLTLGNTEKGADGLAASYARLTAAMKGVENVAILGAERRITEELAAIRREAESTADSLSHKLLFALGSYGNVGSEAGFPGPDTTAIEQSYKRLGAVISGFRSSGDLPGLVASLHALGQAGGTDAPEFEKLAEALAGSAKRADELDQQAKKLAAEQRLLNGTATAADRALLDQAAHHKDAAEATRDHASALGEYMQRLQASAQAAGLGAAQQETMRDLTEASAAAQRDYNANLRDTPLLTEEEAASIRRLAAAKQADIAASRSAQSDQSLRERIAEKQMEVRLAGQNAALRTKEIADLQARNELAREGWTQDMAGYDAELAKRKELNDELAKADLAWKKQQEDQRKAQQIAREFGSTLDSAFRTLISSTGTWHDKLVAIGDDFANLILKLTVIKPLEDAVAKELTSIMGTSGGSSGSSGSGGSIFGGMLGGVFGSIFNGTGASSSSWGFARGAAFDRGRVIPFARGDVFASPTYFGLAGGNVGVMAEDGMEAAMPITRMGNGKLGVAATGAMAPQSHYYIDARGAAPGVEDRIAAVVKMIKEVNASIERRAVTAVIQARSQFPAAFQPRR